MFGIPARLAARGGGFTSKLHCLADALRRPLAFYLAVSEEADCKAYDADAIRADLAERKLEAVIPGRSSLRVKIDHDRALYKQRDRIEHMFGQLKINRAITTRYDQLAISFLAWSISPQPDTGSNLPTPPSPSERSQSLHLRIACFIAGK